MRKIILYFFVSVIIFSQASCNDCDEKVEIDSTFYSVGEIWCGKKIDSADIADPENLVRLPEELCSLDYKIYVSKECRDALVKMAEVAGEDSIFFMAKSGYRSERYQKILIKRRMDKGESVEEIFKMVAPPGYSEHGTGMAMDLTVSEGKFFKSDAYQWLLENGHKFGFYETYPKENGPGILWEPWHWIYKIEGQDSGLIDTIPPDSISVLE